MIQGEQSVLRSAGVDDAPFFHGLYRRAEPLAALLDQRRECWSPTLDELTELFGTNQGEQTRDLYAIEDLEGTVKGFAGIRTNARDNHLGNFIMMLIDPAEYAKTLADEIGAYLQNVAFRQKLLRKVMTQALDHETEYRAFLLRSGFTSDGVQRDVVYTNGRWHSLEAFTLFNPGA